MCRPYNPGLDLAAQLARMEAENAKLAQSKSLNGSRKLGSQGDVLKFPTAHKGDTHEQPIDPKPTAE